MEIKHMDTIKYRLIEPYIIVNPNAVRRININKADFKTLSEHPYIGYNIAISLTNYRSKHGNYSKVEDIKKTALITDANYDKISRYLKAD